MPNPRPHRSRYCLPAAAALCTALGLVPVAGAQGLSRGPSQPSIEVDLSVLNELGGAQRPAATIPPGLFPSPRQQTNVGVAFDPPQPAARPAGEAAVAPGSIPVSRPSAGPALPASTTAARGIKDPARVRAPSAEALQASNAPVANPAAKEAPQVRPPAAAAVEAAPDEPAPGQEAEATQLASMAPVERPEPQAAPAAPAAPEPAAAQPESLVPEEGPAAPVLIEDEPAEEAAETGTGAEAPIPLPELNIEEPVAGTPPAGEDGPADQPALADGVPVPEPEALDALEEESETAEGEGGLPPVNAPGIPVREEGAQPAETEVASVPADQASERPADQNLRIVFSEPNAEISPQADGLISGLSQRLARDENLRLQIRAYAGGTPEAATQARRLSLDRALAVRSLLIERGVRGTRIDIRALGNSAPDEPRDRVDLLVQ